ncbi:MAG: DUF3604 domain-containing protein [Deltaproteobacteria bacterium]|nr:DUF3604 domain-containing protein [Deltaproteobacteria bacterium]
MMKPRDRMIELFVAAILSTIPTVATAEKHERNVYYGDLHLHTSYSTDAVFLSGIRIGLDDAYRFARGEAVDYSGQSLRRAEPLDFIAVTDHAEQMGVGRALFEADGPLAQTEMSKALRAGRHAPIEEVGRLFQSKQPIAGVDVLPILEGAWREEKEAVDRHHRPGTFTTFLGYEWSSSPKSQNLHRNVIFRGNEAPLPFSSNDSPRPEDLWTYLERNRARGIEALAIPHNADVSNGLMYALTDSDGKPIDAEYARRRALNEPIGEIYQSKGQSETHPLLSPSDELAGFELFEHLMGGPGRPQRGQVSGSYFREAWGRGLALSERIGANPFRFGVVGATDLHNGLADTREATYRGPGLAGDLPTDVVKTLLGTSEIPNPVIPLIATGSGGLTGIWAEENTREALYDALRRSETFATSGTRISLRVFAGWNYGPDLLRRSDMIARAEAGGVAMGGTLTDAATGRSPRFLILAQQDAKGARLERLQIIKVWVRKGEPSEKVFDVEVAQDGARTLEAIWQDPDFDATEPSLYYVRVLEMPTPRWSTLLARSANLPRPKDQPESIRERAWSSPIWYEPSRSSASAGEKSVADPTSRTD